MANPSHLLTPYDILNGNLHHDNSDNIDWSIDMNGINENAFDQMMQNIVNLVLEPNTYNTLSSNCGENCDVPGENIHFSKNTSNRKKLSTEAIMKIKNALQNKKSSEITSDKLVSYKSTSNEFIQDRNSRFECLKNGIPRSDWNRNRKLECHRQNRSFDNGIIVN